MGPHKAFKELKNALAEDDFKAINELLALQKTQVMLMKKHKLVHHIENHLNNVVLRQQKLKENFIEQHGQHLNQLLTTCTMKKNRTRVKEILDQMAERNPALFKEFGEAMGGLFTCLIQMAETDPPQDLEIFLDEPADYKLDKIQCTETEVRTWLKNKVTCGREKANKILNHALNGQLFDRAYGVSCSFPYPDINKQYFGIAGTIPEIIKKINLPQYAGCIQKIIDLVEGDATEVVFIVKEMEVVSE